MQYFSTRNDRLTHTAAQAMAMGIAPDGGLFVPAYIPTVDKAFLRRLAGLDYRARAVEIMGLYLEEFTREELEGFVTAAYADNFDDPAVAPLRQ